MDAFIPRRNNPEPLFYEKDQAILNYSTENNAFVVSSLSEFYCPVHSTGFAIKFVTEGNERYLVDGQPYVLGAGSYLLLSGKRDANVEIESRKNVKGICIDISAALIADVVAGLVRPDTPFSDPGLASFFYAEHFLENQYQSVHTLLGSRLLEISRRVQVNTLSADDINTGLFFELAERLIRDQAGVFKQLRSIHAIKPATKRDLCRRLIRGREFIDSYFANPLSIADIAKEAAMSEYHFFRLFKKAFEVSPHQYILRKRLDTAKLLLQEGHGVSDAAIECGFSDIFTFSKAFKKHFGIAPSAIGTIK